ncbi:ferric-dicitrate binding protein FerR, regulates iron transport through sigma-19 [Chitinophaga eiseniae]|uniref:Ferric-dicitrate binding protein FerR, regulates iron transport through sigma-19 n=1 Tax=Chitinophaga eiseniae TaxID=634771 RepID=A0A1T4M9I8_9BACT|nr:FecR domain-containing protein [Chitinophaga eiseniae]SJZ63700.1 ferric-dicitrate binding protein FerR, regulates iron transport through sigma-19 [Chitinophaga eiseniae]
MDYHHYDKNDFLEDASLLAYVKGNDPVVTRFWEDWAQQQPPNIGEFRKAVFLLRHLLSAERINARPGTEQELWGRISQTIDTAAATPVRRMGLRRWIAAAAVFLLLAGAGIGYYIYRYTGTQIAVYAAYGTKKQIILADASMVTLNANSSLRYARHWGKNSVREVWLDGEAYFEVKHLKDDALPLKAGERFLVHAGKLDIEVLGTTFNVKDRRGITTVYLKNGVVKVGTNATDALNIQPGEEAEYRQQEGLLTKHPGDAGAAAWLDNKMVLHNTPVKEIVQVLEDSYGYKVVLTDTAVANRKINGVLPLKNTETLLYILSNMLDVDINVNKSDSTLLFRPGK